MDGVMDWSSFRSELPVTERWAFFDHAAVAPLSARAQRAMHEWAADITENGDVHHGQWMKRVESVRGLFGRLLNCDPLDVAFIKNTSEGVGIVAEGIAWQPGDNVVTAQEEYPANVYPWMNLSSRGVELRRVATRDGRVVLDELLKAMDSRTRVLALSWVEFATGYRNDLDALAAMCQEHGVLSFVDAIQGLGVFPLDLHKTPIDFLAADGHKWLLGPEGAGILYVRRELVESLRPIDIGWNSVVGAKDFSRIDFDLKPHAGRWESGSLNVAGVMALGASLELLLQIGIENTAARVLELTDHLCRQVATRPYAKVYSSRSPAEASAIVSLTVPDTGALPSVTAALRIKGIVINQRSGRLRVSPHFYNTVEELDKLMVCLDEQYR
jgi:selenocysteine lyase/cysteine desulfurase